MRGERSSRIPALTEQSPGFILTTMVVNIVNQLKELGLSEYEGKIYLALLAESPLTAYEAAKQAGVPSSKVYPVMEKLAERGLILEIARDDRKKYVPQDPEEFVENRRFHINRTLDLLSEELKKNRREENVSYIWNLNDYPSFIEQAEKLIAGAESTLLLSAWPEELAAVTPLLREKEAEGVKIATVLFGESGTGAGEIFLHPIQDTLYQERGGRGFALVRDGKTALMGTIRKDRRVEGAWSHGPGFVLLAEDYIKHDIYIMKIVRRFDAELIGRFGPGYALLRDVYSDRDRSPGGRASGEGEAGPSGPKHLPAQERRERSR